MSMPNPDWRPHYPGGPRRCSRYLAAVLAIAILLGIAGHAAAPASAQTAATPLAAGWNNVLYTGPPGPVSAALGYLGDQLSGLVIWDAVVQRWHSYLPASPQSSDLQTVLPGQVYWIAVKAASFLPPGIATPSPARLVPGWNNVAYLGPGAPGSSLLEQSPVWTWDGALQKWLMHDPAHPGASDFQVLTELRAYWVNVPGASGGSAPAPLAPPPTPAPRAGGCYQFSSPQPLVSDVDDAVTRAGNAGLHIDPLLDLPPERTGADGSATTQPPYVPPTILRSIAWIETSWHQATWDTQRGQNGPTLTSDGCAYGLMQVVSGMALDSSAPSPLQQLIGSDFRANTAAGAQLLVKNWNRDGSVLPYYGRHDPHVLEDWYFAIWAYHCFGDTCADYGAHDNPDDPALTWPRPSYNSAQQLASGTSLTYSDYPYEELVLDLVSNPPIVDGRSLWQGIPLQLPPRGAVGFPQPHAVGEASAHLDNGASLPVFSATATPPPAIPPGAPQIVVPTATPPAGG